MNSLNNLKGKTVVVTGASGYIGFELVKALVSQDCKVIRVSRSDLTPQLETKIIKSDITDASTWTKIVEQADIIYHLAGNTSVYDAEKNPSANLKSSLLPLTHLIKAAQDKKRNPKVVFASTATVYGMQPLGLVAETIEPKPITVYDLHKLFAEQQLKLATEEGVLKGVSLRLSNVFGPSSGIRSADDRGILNKVTAAALRGQNLELYGEGIYIRDYIFISDVIHAFLLAGNTAKINGQSYNIASGSGTSVSKAFETVVSRVKEITGISVEINNAVWPTKSASIERRNFTANIRKFSNATGWFPATTLEVGIDHLVRALLKQETV